MEVDKGILESGGKVKGWADVVAQIMVIEQKLKG